MAVSIKVKAGAIGIDEREKKKNHWTVNFLKAKVAFSISVFASGEMLHKYL